MRSPSNSGEAGEIVYDANAPVVSLVATLFLLRRCRATVDPGLDADDAVGGVRLGKNP